MKRIFLVLSILLAVFACYGPSLRNGLVWDDTALVLRDPLIRSWRLIPEGFNHFLFTDATPSDFYRPIQRLTYTLDYAIAAFKPAQYHFSSLACHTLAAIALFFFAEELLLVVARRNARAVAFLAALVWSIHPINTSAVAYVSGRADPLSAAFGFLGLYLVLRSARGSTTTEWLQLAGATLSFLLSALSKESGLIFPLLAIGLFALQKNWSAIWKPVALATVVGVIYFVPLRLAADHPPPPVLSKPAPALVRPIIVSRAIAEYAGLLIFPWRLHMDRDVETHPSGLSPESISGAAWRELETLAGILVLAAFVYWLVRARRRDFPVFVCLIFFATCYVPISGLIALNATIAEHWLYLPAAFLFLAAVLQTAGFLETRQRVGRSTTAVAIILAGIWIAFLGTRTFIRTFDWKDEHTFFERTIAQGGDSARMLINLGNLEMSEGKLEDAAIHFHAALQKKPDQPFAILNLAAIALKQNDFKLARELLERAIKMEPVEAQAQDMLTVLEHRETGNVNMMRMRLASRTGPPNWAIEKRYIMLLDETGARPAAIKELQACIKREWYRAESWQMLSDLLNKADLRDLAALASIRAHQYDVHLDEH